MTAGSLFSGIGGMDLGLERAGFRVEWQVEIDPDCRRVLERHWPSVRRHGDVRTFRPPPVDLVCGGFPCQPFSAASRGRRRGTADSRWLWPEMRRVVSECQPTWVLCENVTHFDGAGLEQVVSDLEALGYEVAPPFEIPACAFGYDHWRPRLWVLGYADHEGKSELPEHAEMAELPRAGSVGRDNGAANGIPAGMAHRMLGNAVVPDVAEFIGRAILAPHPALPPSEKERG